MGLDSVAVSVDFDDVDGKCDDRSFNAVLNPLPRRSIAALSFQKKKRRSEDGSIGARPSRSSRRSSAFGERSRHSRSAAEAWTWTGTGKQTQNHTNRH